MIQERRSSGAAEEPEPISAEMEALADALIDLSLIHI